MTSGGTVDPQAWDRVTKAVRRVERAKHYRQRSTRPFYGGGIAGEDTEGPLTDGCQCDGGKYVQGVDLSGSDPAPAVCCNAHRELIAHMGGTWGSRVLYYAGGDVWSTYNADNDKDNPWSNTCPGGGTDVYDMVLDIGANTFKLQRRTGTNCDEVCFEYDRKLLFGCAKSNQFNLRKFGNMPENIAPPMCVCIKPTVVPAEPHPHQCDDQLQCPDGFPDWVTLTIPPGSVWKSDSTQWTDETCVVCQDLAGSYRLTWKDNLAGFTHGYEGEAVLGPYTNWPGCGSHPIGCEPDIVERLLRWRLLICDHDTGASYVELYDMKRSIGWTGNPGDDPCQIGQCIALWQKTGNTNSPDCLDFEWKFSSCAPVFGDDMCHFVSPVIVDASGTALPATDSGHCLPCSGT